jgi:hypothetical protein
VVYFTDRDLGRQFPSILRARTRPKIESFLENHQPPLIAKVYRPSPQDLAGNPDASARIELWYPKR